MSMTVFSVLKLWPIAKALLKLDLKKLLASNDEGWNQAVNGAVADVSDGVIQVLGSKEKAVRSALDVMVGKQDELLSALRAQGEPDLPYDLSSPGKEIAEAIYLREMQGKYLYADFRGIVRIDKTIPIPLDEIFVDLRALAESSHGLGPIEDLAERLGPGGLADEEFAIRMEERDVERLLRRKGRGGGRSAKAGSPPRPIAEFLKVPGGLVLLGDPGSGKSTLVKRIARSCALGRDEFEARFPGARWGFPVVLTYAEYDESRGQAKDGLYATISAMMAKRWGEALRAAFQDHWTAGSGLVLLDGLDEVADAGHRHQCSRDTDDLLRDAGGNRVVLTSRIIGYSACRLSGPAVHAELAPFEPDDTAEFVRKWRLAYEKAVKEKAPDLEGARRQAEELIQEIRGRPHVASLASNPLMLTIIALIKDKGVRLPERRVELYEVALRTLIDSWNHARGLYCPADGPHRPPSPRYDASVKVWCRVAFWMHSEKNRGQVAQGALFDKLVECLVEQGLSAHEAHREAESYLEAAKHESGILQPKGPSTFGFLHQTFQEFLAAYHLAIPTGKAITKIRPLRHDPRWHEPIRLACGIIGVLLPDSESVTDLVEEVADDAGDPLESFLFRNLRLAAACLADDVGVRPSGFDAIVERLCRAVEDARNSQVLDSLTDSMRALPGMKPGPRAIKALSKMKSHENWKIRMECCRRLVPAHDEPNVYGMLEDLLKDDDPDVQAHAAHGLWLDGHHDAAILTALVRGIQSSSTEIRVEATPVLIRSVVGLLADADPDVRWSAAETVGGWGPQQQAVPALVGLLAHADPDVRWSAAATLGGWGPQEQAVPALVGLLADADPGVRLSAAETLGGWGHREQAVPALVGLLADEDPGVRRSAAETVGGWGHREQAVPALVGLLAHAGTSVRRSAASTLGGWGHREQAVPALVGLLADEDPGMRRSAARTLGGWGRQEQAVPALVGLLADANPGVRLSAAETLGSWEPLAGIREPIVRGLGLNEDNARMVGEALDTGVAARLSGPVAEVLARELAPHPRERSRKKQGCRDVLFRWVWNLANSSGG